MHVVQKAIFQWSPATHELTLLTMNVIKCFFLTIVSSHLSLSMQSFNVIQLTHTAVTLKTVKSDSNIFFMVFDVFSNLFDLNQTDTHKTFLIKLEDFFLMQVKNSFLAFFSFRAELVENKFKELKIEWLDPVDSTESVNSLLFSYLSFFYLAF